MTEKMPIARIPNPRGSGEQLRHDLVAAARELLVGPQEIAPFSLRAVAKAVGVSPTAVYRHFDSAGSLVEAVLDDENNALREALGTAEPAPTSIDLQSMNALALRYVRWGLANPGAYQLLFERADRIGHRGGPGAPGWDMIEALAALLGASLHLDEASATVLAIRVWSALHGLTSLRLHKPGLQWPTSVDDEVTAITALLFTQQTRLG